MLSFRQIRYFVAVANAGQISLAAADLNVSQAAVSAAIKGLEEEIQSRLFERHARGVSLTYEGHQFLQHAQNIVAAMAEAMRAPGRSAEGASGVVNVGVTYTVAGYFLPQILSRFRRAFPAIEVRMREMDRDEIERGIIDGALDIAVMLVSNLQNADRIESEILLRSPRRLWLPADHRLMARESVSLAEIARESYVMLTVDEADRTAYRYWELTPYRPKVEFATTSVEAVRSMVALGMGVTVLSNMVYRPWSLEGQRIEVRPVTEEVPSMDVGLVWRRGLTMPRPVRMFFEYLSLTFSGTIHGLPGADASGRER